MLCANLRIDSRLAVSAQHHPNGHSAPSCRHWRAAGASDTRIRAAMRSKRADFERARRRRPGASLPSPVRACGSHCWMSASGLRCGVRVPPARAIRSVSPRGAAALRSRRPWLLSPRTAARVARLRVTRRPACAARATAQRQQRAFETTGKGRARGCLRLSPGCSCAPPPGDAAPPPLSAMSLSAAATAPGVAGAGEPGGCGRSACTPLAGSTFSFSSDSTKNAWRRDRGVYVRGI